MLQIPDPQTELIARFSKNSKIAGIVFLILGVVGLVFPTLMSVTSALFFGWILIFSAIMAAMHTWRTSPRDWLGWLKTLGFGLGGGVILIDPGIGIAALGILFAVYFMFDALNNFALAAQMQGAPYRWAVLFNGVVSLVLALILLWKWPMSSVTLVGLLVGISLLLDGIMLLAIAGGTKPKK